MAMIMQWRLATVMSMAAVFLRLPIACLDSNVPMRI
jgi:hypothetical protein